MKPSRLDLYYKYIISFDSFDRNINKINKIFLKNINIKTDKHISSLKLEILTLGLILEILTQQRFLITFIKNRNFSNFNYFQIHINKNKFLLLLDMYLISTFFYQLKKRSFLNIKIVHKLYMFISTQIINNLNLTNLHKGKSYFDLGVNNNFYKFY